MGHINEQEFTRRMGVTAREASPGMYRASPQRSPSPTTAGPWEAKPQEGALVHAPFLFGKQPKSEPGKAATQRVGPETTAPPSPPGSVGRQLVGAVVETGSWPISANLGINSGDPAKESKHLGQKGLNRVAWTSLQTFKTRTRGSARRAGARGCSGACGGGRGWARACGSARADPEQLPPPFHHLFPPLPLPVVP